MERKLLTIAPYPEVSISQQALDSDRLFHLIMSLFFNLRRVRFKKPRMAKPIYYTSNIHNLITIFSSRQIITQTFLYNNSDQYPKQEF